ncbi:ABC transporter ATP-binding protein, partial [Candidatus Aerophobetes bacterium]
ITSIIGPNGAGKTTFFNLLTGFYKPDEGRIFFKDEDITPLPVHKIIRRGISRSFQVLQLFENFTVMENVWIGVQAAKGYGKELFSSSELQDVREKTEEMIKKIGLSDKMNTLIKYLSHGERRMIDVIISLTSNPELLLLDEPMAGLASEERLRMSNFIKNLSENLTIIVVEHDMDVVFSISDKIAVMHQGELIAVGSPEEIRQNEQVQQAYLGEAR